MKKAFITLTSILLTAVFVFDSVAMAFGVEDSTAYKKYKNQREYIQDFWNKLQRASAVGNTSGDYIAALALLEEAEADLRERGVSEPDLEILKAEANRAVEERKFETTKRVARDQIYHLAENLNTLSVADIETGLSQALEFNEKFKAAYEIIKAQKPVSGTEAFNSLSYKLSLGFLIFAILEDEKVDLSKSKNQRLLDPFLATLEAFTAAPGSAPVGGQFAITIVSPTSPKLSQTLLKRWKTLHPKQSQFQYTKMFWPVLKVMPKAFLTNPILLVMTGYTAVKASEDQIHPILAWSAVGLLLALVYFQIYVNSLPNFVNANPNGVRNAGKMALDFCGEKMDSLRN